MDYNTMNATVKGTTCEGEPFTESLTFILVPPTDNKHYGTGYYMTVKTSTQTLSAPLTLKSLPIDGLRVTTAKTRRTSSNSSEKGEISMNENEAKTLIERFAEKQQGGHFACPRCGKMTMDAESVTRNALSRRATVHICDACGMQEALEDMMDSITPLTAWAIVAAPENWRMEEGGSECEA